MMSPRRRTRTNAQMLDFIDLKFVMIKSYQKSRPTLDIILMRRITKQ
jgi:hypothetical protein